MDFFNSFQVIDSYIGLRDDLKPFKLKPIQASFDIADAYRPISNLLKNAWSAEYALRITPVVNDEQYLQSSLHWTFPQAFYSVLFTARAFLAAQGMNVSNEELIRKRIANYVAKGYYPASIGYYAFGAPDNYKTSRLVGVPLIADFLKDTRNHRVKLLRKAIQNNPKTALRSPKTGEILNKFSIEQYRQLAKQIGYTTFFDLLSRLRISSANRDLERLDLPNIDVRAFHASLTSIISHINAVHELYIAQCLGAEGYRQLVADLPSYLQESFVTDRMHSVVLSKLTEALQPAS